MSQSSFATYDNIFRELASNENEPDEQFFLTAGGAETP